MEDRGNKTIICSVLFLDIVEYSKKSVTGQISLKDRFNTYLSEAIHDVPVTDRIILDTGDGAAVNFLGDVEAALNAAIRLRASLLSEDPALEPPLLVRIGINLGPVRLVRDINGQPNIVGDGINVAQRVMGFADPSQILVSRSYFDAVSRLSDQYTGMFHYQGSRTDKHVREHEIYAIGYPGEQISLAIPESSDKQSDRYAQIRGQARAIVASVAARPAAWSEKFRQADAKQRVLYSAVIAVPLLLLAVVFALLPARHSSEIQWADKAGSEPAPAVETMQSVMPAVSAVVPEQVKEASAGDVKNRPVVDKVAADMTAADKLVAQARHKADLLAAKKAAPQVKSGDAQVKKAEAGKAAPDSDDNKSEPAKDAYLVVTCKDDVQLFVDGASKGKFTTGSLSVTTKPGKHKIILTHGSFGLFTDEVDIEPGKTWRMKPKVCN